MCNANNETNQTVKFYIRKKYEFAQVWLEFVFKRAERQLQRESVSKLVFSLEPVIVSLGVTGEFARLGVTEFDSSGIIIGFVELLANSICGIGQTWLSLYGKNES